jgi:hypothetical protein
MMTPPCAAFYTALSRRAAEIEVHREHLLDEELAAWSTGDRPRALKLCETRTKLASRADRLRGRAVATISRSFINQD